MDKDIDDLDDLLDSEPKIPYDMVDAFDDFFEPVDMVDAFDDLPEKPGPVPGIKRK